MARDPETFRREQDIDARVGHEATELDLDGRRVRVRRLSDGAESWEGFDLLMLATGAVPVSPDLPGAGAEGVFGVSTLESGLRLRRWIDRHRPRRAVIVGGSYIGLEMAEAALLRDMRTTVVEAAPEVMGTLDPDMGRRVGEAMIRKGIRLLRGTRVEAFETGGGRVREVVTDDGNLPADLVVLGMGVRPNTRLAREAGIELGIRDAIRTNPRMETGVEGVWAGGDCAESRHLVSGERVHIALGTVANKHGKVAGINIGGGDAVFPGVVGTAVTRICDLEIARTGLQEKDLERLGMEFVSASIESRTRAGYFPGAEKIVVKLLAHRRDGRLLGGQIVGLEGAAKRIDTVAAALHAGFTVSEMAYLDLSYAPPFSPVWDPVQIAARQVEKKLG